MKKLTRKEKYAIVRNITGDSPLAYKARGWSSERIKAEIGIDVVMPRVSKTLKPITKSRSRYLKQKWEKVYLAKVAGYEAEEALKQSSQSKTKLKEMIDKTAFQKDKPDRQASRDKRWGAWSRKGTANYPYAIRMEAERINIKNGYDPNDKYGWAAVHYSYIYQVSVERVMQYLEKDRFSGNVYVNHIRDLTS